MKHFNIKDYIDDFKTLPVSLVYSFEDPNEQLNTLNNLILECIKRHALLVKTKFTHPPAPWMKQDISRRHLKYWVGVQRGQSYLMGRRCLFSLGWPPF